MSEHTVDVLHVLVFVKLEWSLQTSNSSNQSEVEPQTSWIDKITLDII